LFVFRIGLYLTNSNILYDYIILSLIVVILIMKIIYINLQHETNRRNRLLREFNKADIKPNEYEQYASLWGRNIGQKLISLLIKTRN